MKEFEIEIKDIFSGLIPHDNRRKNNPGLIECHNLEPDGEDYGVYTAVIDLNVTGYDWNNAADDPMDIWQDHLNADWVDNQTDIFEDN